MTAKSNDLGFAGKFYKGYSRNILPYIKDIRGTTRFACLLEDLVVQRLEPRFSVVDDRDLIQFLTELEMIELFKEEISAGDVFVDVGGYHGIYSLIAASQGADCICFEAASESADRIVENFGQNTGLEVDLRRKAVWSQDTELNFTEGREGENHVSSEGNTVKAVRLDSELGVEPDVIKVDVEGAEYQVLKGATNILENNKPVIFIEIHDNGRIESLGGSKEEIEELLRKQGYEKNFEKDRGSETHQIWQEKTHSAFRKEGEYV